MDESKAGKAKVGELVTLVYPQDRLPGMVLKVGKNSITIGMLETDGLFPARQCNGFPVFDSRLTGTETVTGTRKAYWSTKNEGYQYAGCVPVWLGEARYFRNFAD